MEGRALLFSMREERSWIQGSAPFNNPGIAESETEDTSEKEREAHRGHRSSVKQMKGKEVAAQRDRRDGFKQKKGKEVRARTESSANTPRTSQFEIKRMSEERRAHRGRRVGAKDKGNAVEKARAVTSASADATKTLESQTWSTPRTSVSVNRSKPWVLQDPAALNITWQRSIGPSKSSVTAFYTPGRGKYCIWCGHSGRDFQFPTDPVSAG
jgi:hypothetical protein